MIGNTEIPPSADGTVEATAETPEEVTTRHKKEVKSLEGEKRSALKNAKSMGKKAKTKIKEVEFKYEGLERDLKERHARELEALNDSGGDDASPVDKADETNDGEQGTTKSVSFSDSTNQQQYLLEQQQDEAAAAEAKRQKALEKKLKKKDAQKQKELDREKRIADENASAGPSRRVLEIEAMTRLYLTPQKLRIQEVPADGNCLYRAVATQALRLGLSTAGDDYKQMRELCANILIQQREEYEPFAELDHDPQNPASTYDEYVEMVRSTSTWGGQLELRALSHGLKVPVVVFSAEGVPLKMGEEYESGTDGDEEWEKKKKAVLVSFHRYYYALGEHYNSVVPFEEGS
jgi:OTU domain-containing protein 6